MAERVGRGASGRGVLARLAGLPAWVSFVFLVGIALVALVVVSIVGTADHPISARVTAIPRQSDPAHFSFSYDVTKNPLSIATCTFQVQDDRHEVIASVDQRIEPAGSNDRTTSHQVTVDTPRQGVTAVVQRCQLLRK